MQTRLSPSMLAQAEGPEAESILRQCVHCGFCLPACPTYQVTGNELDSPRGRIYLIKQVMEGAPVSAITQHHLDRCLTCRSCERACPSLVQYGRLLEIGRAQINLHRIRGFSGRCIRQLFRLIFLSPPRLSILLGLGRFVRPLLPEGWKKWVNPVSAGKGFQESQSSRKMLVLEGCVQPVLAPDINLSSRRVLGHLGITLISAKQAGCCGSLSLHLDAHDEAINLMKRNIDAWWPYIETGVEAIVMTASGCGVTVRDYGKYLAHDLVYAEKARRVSELTRDICEILEPEWSGLLARYPRLIRGKKLAFHAPCTLQHGQGVQGVIEDLLIRAGALLTEVPDGHMCCGSAGTYFILQPGLSNELRRRRLAALESGSPEMIVTANMGCMSHLAACSKEPVRHWIQLIDDAISSFMEQDVPNTMS